MTDTARRTGVTLVELLVAMVLLLLVLGMAAVASQRTLAVEARTSALVTQRAALADALQTLRRQVVSVHPSAGDLLAASDSVLEIVHDVGVTTVCRHAGDTLVVTAGSVNEAWSTTLPRAITTDDRLLMWHDDDARWVSRRIRYAGGGSGACGDSGGVWPGTASQRLILDSVASGVRPGAIVRVRQRERWSMSRGADGEWSLSLATWDAAADRYATPQPLLAPLSAPGAPGGSGFSVRAADAAGRSVTGAWLATARQLAITLRLRAHAPRPPVLDSVAIDVGTN